jgi:phage gp16-like protein
MAAPLKSNDNIRRLRAQVHIARKELGLDEETYRAALMRITGKNSCSTLGVVQLCKVIADFKNKGWQPRANKWLSPKSSHKIDNTVIDKIRAVWISMGKCGALNDASEPALEAWVKRHTSQRNNGIGVDRVDWLERDPKMAAMVLESLKQWFTRTERKWLNEDLALISKIQAAQDRPQVDVIRELLDAQRVMWWKLFRDLGIEQSPAFLSDRRFLQNA